MRAHPLEERRHASRPRNGDTKPCPKCGQSACYEFNDRYRFDDVGVAPAWICGCPPCHYRELVRSADRRLGDRALAQPSGAARAKRQMMKVHALTERAQERPPQAKRKTDPKRKS